MADTVNVKHEFRCPNCGNVQFFSGSPGQQIIAVCSSCGTKGKITFSSNITDESIAIRVSNLKKVFGDLVAVDDISFSVKRGEIFGFLGPNGAGKTTTVRMLCCLISKTSGEVIIEGYDISNNADQQKIRSIIGLLPENVGLYDDLSAYRNLDFYGQLYKMPEEKRKERVEYFLRLLDLWDKRDVKAGSFSKGMKQKLSIARALIHDPKVLFLDEPTANLDPEAAKTVRDFILELKKEKRTIFLNTHNLDEAQRICDRVGIIKTKMIEVGTIEQLREALSGRKTIIHVDKINDKIVAAVKKLKFKSVKIENNDTLIVDVDNPDMDNPNIVNAIVAAGGRVQSISEINPTLEDIYLKLVRS